MQLGNELIVAQHTRIRGITLTKRIVSAIDVVRALVDESAICRYRSVGLNVEHPQYELSGNPWL